MVKVDRKCGIVLQEKVSKLLLMFQRIMLQIRGIFMNSGLQEKSRVSVTMIMVIACISLFSDMISF